VPPARVTLSSQLQMKKSTAALCSSIECIELDEL